jgi:hypothetical protein
VPNRLPVTMVEMQGTAALVVWEHLIFILCVCAVNLCENLVFVSEKSQRLIVDVLVTSRRPTFCCYLDFRVAASDWLIESDWAIARFFASEIERLIAPIYRERDQERMVLSDIDRNFSAI